jgi:putative ABC transport system permease protein
VPERRAHNLGIGKSFSMAISSIINNKMRSFLTMLGIIIGIMAVIVLVSVMNGLTGEVTDMFNEIGTTSITVSIQPRSIKKLDPDDMFDWADQNPELFSRVSPNVTLSGTVKTSSSGDDSIMTSCRGVSENYIDMKDMTVAFGRFLQYIDCEREMKTCVIGTYQALYFFNSASGALNQELKINGVPYKIVGVLEETEDSTESSGDDIIYIPYTTAMKASGSTVVSSYTVMATSEDTVTPAVNSIKTLLNDKIGDSDYYTVTSMLSMIDTMTDIMNKMSMVLVAIAAISLLVGGIGIMNIMLVSVTERTREIGIRKSLGAKHKHIMTQFVMEAATVSCLGGIIGIILGSTLAVLAGKLLGMSTNPSVGAIGVAFGVSVAIGIAFGFLPARKAAQLNPIDALRYD